jgi:periplasmic protein TonB
MVSNAEVARRYEFEAVTTDPFNRLAALAELDHRRFSIALLVTIAIHFATIGRALAMQTGLHAFAADVDRQLSHTRLLYEIRVEEPPPPPPPPPEPEPEPEPQPVHAVAAAAPPPAPAQAGKVLAADPDPNEPVDLTGNTFVQGDADTYVGGVTASKGTGTSAVYNAVPSGTGPPAPPPPPIATVKKEDQSRQAMPLSGSWNHCGFPAEADIEQVNYARVTVAVTIGADGTATTAAVVQDPGYGFGALAKRCALKEHYQPAKNRDGVAVTTTQMITINFKR